MAIERTLSIIKPDAVAKNVIGQIYTRFENAGLRIVAAQMRQLSQAEAEGFYAVHKERPFFKDLVAFMTSGPVMIQVLEGEGAIAKLTSLKALMLTLFTAPTLRKRLLWKSPTSSRRWRFANASAAVAAATSNT